MDLQQYLSDADTLERDGTMALTEAADLDARSKRRASHSSATVRAV